MNLPHFVILLLLLIELSARSISKSSYSYRTLAQH